MQDTDNLNIESIADDLTIAAMKIIFGIRCISCNDITDDSEMSDMWDALNEEFWNILSSVFCE